MALNKEALFAAASKAGLPREVVAIPEFGEGVTLIVRCMTGVQRDAFEKRLTKKRPDGRQVDTNDNFRARFLVECIVNDADQLVFTSADAEAIGQWRLDVLDRLMAVANRLCGFGQEARADLGKDSAPTDGSASPTS